MKSRFLKDDGPPGLVLTPLLDMFTIILIFLIVSFEAEDYEFKLNPDLTLPTSSARSVFKPAVNVEITSEDLICAKKHIVKLKKGQFDEKWHRAGEITPLVERLKTAKENVLANMESEEDAEEASIVLIQADKAVDYKNLYLVLRSASMAGFVKYRLAIMKK